LTGEWRAHEFVVGEGSKEYKEGLYFGGLRGVGGIEVKREGMGMFLFRYSAQVFVGYWKDDTYVRGLCCCHLSFALICMYCDG
jgi:hypothetical protein